MDKKNKNKGFTVIELVVSFALISIIVIGMLTIALGYRNDAGVSVEQLTMVRYKDDVTKAIQTDIVDLGISTITKTNNSTLVFNFDDGTYKTLTIDIFNKEIYYGGRKFEMEDPDGRIIMKNPIFTEESGFDGDNTVYTIDIDIRHADIEGEFGIHIVTLKEVYKPNL